MLEKIRKKLIESELDPHDLRTVLDILNEIAEAND